MEAYAAGINDFVDSMDWYPIEFTLANVKFEHWTVADSLGIQAMMQYFISFDWFLEITRQRLTEIYDKELVDRMIPFRQEDYFFNNTNCKCYPTYIPIVISDEELKEAGRYEPNANIYDIDEDLLYFRRNDQPKAKKMNHF